MGSQRDDLRGILGLKSSAPGANAVRATPDADAGALAATPPTTGLPIVCIQTPEEAHWIDLAADLQSLGFQVRWAIAGPGPTADGSLVVRLIDIELRAPAVARPHIIIARAATAESVKSVIDKGAYLCAVKPIDIVSLAAAIQAAARAAAELENLLERKQAASTVVGILMERYHLSHTEAYERLRRYARTERRKIADVAAHVLASADQHAGIVQAIVAPLASK